MQACPGGSQWRTSRNFRISSLGIPARRLVLALDALVGTQSLAEICRTSGALCVSARSTNAVDRTAGAHAADKPEIGVIVALMLPSLALLIIKRDEMAISRRIPRDCVSVANLVTGSCIWK